ncbi:MAG: M14 family zinc carboxypeptidase, partial [Bacteroidales bacterium]
EGGTQLVAVHAADPYEYPDDKLHVLIFAQQHGNEQSGKEAALLLIRDLAEGKYNHWYENLEIWIVPQLNPDGSDVNERRNAGGIDLNRDHIVQLAPETRAIHELFREFNAHVTVDIHEYYPYSESWSEFGGYKNFDLQVGIPTNINVDSNIRSFALNNVLPHIEQHLNEQGFSFHNYLVGPAPSLGRLRHSTVDFDDGRQSFAIRNTLSFIYEGINGEDRYVENLARRTTGQYEGLVALLEFLHARAGETREIIVNAQEKLKTAQPGDKVAVRMEHFPDGNALKLPLSSATTGQDTLVLVENYHPLVQSNLDVSRPSAYLVPAGDHHLMEFLELHQLEYETTPDLTDKTVTQYYVASIEASMDEELPNRFPQVTTQTFDGKELTEEFVLVPTAQLHSNFMVSLFEPQSMLGLAQRPGYEYLLQEGEVFGILRVE